MRGSVPWPVVLLLCVAVWAATRACSETSRQTSDSPGLAPPPPSTPVEQAAPATAPSVAAAGPSAADRAADAGDPTETVAAAVDDAPVWSAVRIAVHDADGAPLPRALVYALPAGAPGVDSDDTVSSARTNDRGLAELWITEGQLWDITAIDGALMARALDVRAGAADVVTLRLERSAPLVVALQFADERFRRSIWFPLVIARDGAPIEPARQLPGRNESQRVLRAYIASMSDNEIEIRAPEGVPVELDRAQAAALTPRVLTAPGRALLVGGKELSIPWRIVCDRDGVPTSRARAVVDLVWRGKQTWETERVEVLARPEAAPGVPLTYGRQSVIPGDSGVVSWSGEGVVPGETSWTAPADPLTSDLVLPIRISRWESLPEPRGTTVNARFDGVPADEVVEWFVAGSGDPLWDFSEAGTAPNPIVVDRVPLTIGGLTATRIATSVQVGAGARHDVTLRFEPAGRVSVAIEGALPATVPVVVIRRADGAPLSTIEGLRARRSAVVQCVNGALLGPFLPGDVDLEFVAAGVVVARRKVTVVAGRTVPLVVAVAAAR